MSKEHEKETVEGWCLWCRAHRSFTKITEGKKMTWTCHTCGKHKIGYKKTRKRRVKAGE